MLCTLLSKSAFANLHLESFQANTILDKHTGLSLNQQELLVFLYQARYFLNIRALGVRSYKDAGPLGAIRIMCAQLLLQFEGPRYDILAFDDSQKYVYGHWRSDPIFFGDGTMCVNMDWVLHCMSFFRHHVYKDDVGDLCRMLKDEKPSQRPSAWKGPITGSPTAMPIGKKWRGSYAFLDTHELEIVRRLRYQVWDGIVQDQNMDSGEGCIQVSIDHYHTPLDCEVDTLTNNRNSLSTAWSPELCHGPRTLSLV